MLSRFVTAILMWPLAADLQDEPLASLEERRIVRNGEDDDEGGSVRRRLQPNRGPRPHPAARSLIVARIEAVYYRPSPRLYVLV